ncbi:MAG: cytochrome c [Anaerolineales bacterium]|nr:cytochrome c [Anaerolineales bacterium]
MNWKLATAYLLLLLLVACTGAAVGETAVSNDPVALGRRLYVPACAGCHGEQGEGYVSAVPAPALNSSGTLWQQTDQQIYDWIADGKLDGDNPMPGNSNQFTDDQIWAIVAYLHTLWSEEQQAAQP